MLTFPAAIRVYLCTVPCDMRRNVEWQIMQSSEADEHKTALNAKARRVDDSA